MAASLVAPNLCELIGLEVCERLLGHAGSLDNLANLSDTALRLCGLDARSGEEGAHTTRGKSLQAGYLLEAPVFVRYFGNDEIRAHDLKAARKSLALLARRCVLAARVDLAGGTSDGSFGRKELDSVRGAFERLCAEGKVSAVDEQALPVPEVRQRGEPVKKRRGGFAEYKKWQRRQSEPVSVVEKALTRVRMGVSEEEQRDLLLQRSDIRVGLMEERERELQRAGRKKARNEVHDEYDDLLDITL